jgi:hypothetical protein
MSKRAYEDMSKRDEKVCIYLHNERGIIFIDELLRTIVRLLPASVKPLPIDVKVLHANVKLFPIDVKLVPASVRLLSVDVKLLSACVRQLPIDVRNHCFPVADVAHVGIPVPAIDDRGYNVILSRSPSI